MINVLYGIVEVTATFLEFFLGIKLIGHLVGVKEESLLKCLLGSLVLMGAIQIISRYKLFPMTTSLIAIIGLGVTASLIYKKNISDMTTDAIFYATLINVIDFGMNLFWRGNLETEGMEIVGTQIRSERGIYYVIGCELLLIGIYVILVKRVIPSIEIAIRKKVVGVIACLWLIMCLGGLRSSNIGVPILVVCVIVFLMVLVGLYIKLNFLTRRKTNRGDKLVSEHNNLIAFSYKMLRKKYETRRQLYHDMNNHYLAIRGYIEAGNQEKALAYMNNVGEVLTSSQDQWTGIECLDMLLNYKVNAAAKEGITITIKADLIDLELSEHEVIALVGNALDNAIEACRKVDDGKKWIEVLVRRIQEITYIKISNPYTTVIRDARGRMVTTKEDKTAHGLGIKGMQMIVEKHGGILEYGTEDQIFVLQISFFH